MGTELNRLSLPSGRAVELEMPRKRELIDTGTDKRLVRRDEKGQFKDVVDVG
jgi:hypothetical protein